uniref:Uncharacterized protein n=1 Tax=Siphoviridae sp. ctmqu18 TaxID=2825655 RepID=A0A8S5V6A9_9CAUD|nr:MAG TPA: hypothetical protein [Siphoviridae sp. ctmqu18]
MAWELLRVDYTDASWTGLKRYNQISNHDGTVSFQDVTQYSNLDNSFYGARDANRVNEAINTIMSMIEGNNDLYTAFQNYFNTQKSQFRSRGDASISEIENTYRTHMNDYEREQVAAFTTWFNGIKNQLSGNAVGNLQNQVNEVDDRLARLEHMALTNQFSAAIAVNNSDNTVLLVDESGKAIIADWKYEEE